MNKDILNNLKNAVGRIEKNVGIIEVQNILHFAYVEDKLEITVLLDDTDDVEDVRKKIIKLVKLDYEIPKLKLDVEIKKTIKDFFENKKVITIASGKGGVGKSSVCANLAVSLVRKNKKVLVIDADIYGSSIPKIYEIDEEPKTIDGKIVPLNFRGVEFIATESLNPSGKVLMWRGPMLGKLLNHFFNDILWSEDIEYVLVDLPPGTGDVVLDIQTRLPYAETIIVTTPHENAAHIAVKAGEASFELKHEIIGVVENMSYYEHNGEKLKVFGSGGGDKVARELETELLARIPLGNPSICESIFEESDPQGKIYDELAEKVIFLSKR